MPGKGNRKSSPEDKQDVSITVQEAIQSVLERAIDINGLTLSRDFLTEVKLGNIPGHRLIHKFGHNTNTGATPSPVSTGGVYQTPTSNTSLELLSDDANDTSAGSGARKIIVQGLVLTGGEFVTQEEEIITNGTTPVALANDYIRLFRAWLSESGTYASPTAVSGHGTITIRGAGAGVTWLQIDEFVSGNSAGQSQTALYTTPTNTKSVLFAPTFSVDSTKVAKIILFHRPNADTVTAPFSARRLIHEWYGINIPDGTNFIVPVATFEGATDIGFMASVSVGTGDVGAEFWLLEIDT